MGNKVFHCDFPDCGRSYPKPCKLEEHRLSHTGERPFVCSAPGCNGAFVRKAHLERHAILVHQKDGDIARAFRCTFVGCEKAFALAHHLKRHELVHRKPVRPHIVPNADGLFVCEACEPPREYQSRVTFKRHQDKEHSGMAFYCGTVGCAFATDRWSLLRAHIHSLHPTAKGKCKDPEEEMAEMTDELLDPTKPFACPQPGCTKSYTRKWAMQTHFLASHEDYRPFICGVCQSAFCYKRMLQNHMDRFHGNTADTGQVIEPDEDITSEETLPLSAVLAGVDYEETRPFPCPHCRRRFQRQYDWDRHMVSHASSSESSVRRETLFGLDGLS